MAEEKKPVQEPEQEANTEPAEESAKAAEKEKKKKTVTTCLVFGLSFFVNHLADRFLFCKSNDFPLSYIFLFCWTLSPWMSLIIFVIATIVLRWFFSLQR